MRSTDVAVIPSRRALLLTGASTAALVALENAASALGRIPYGGVIRSSLPWDLSSVDPHDLNDPVAAFLSPLLFEPLFAYDGATGVYPTLAAGPATSTAGGCRIELRPLRWPDGKTVTAAQVAWSLERARQRGAKALLAGVGQFRASGPLTVEVTGAAAGELDRALSSPLTAITSPNGTPSDPLGLGPFRARLTGAEAVLTRNHFASRGLPFLDRLELRRAASLSAALRDFEAHQNNLGWFGRGLHEPRQESRLVDTGHAGWVVLHAGQQSGRWARPGAVSSLMGTVAASSLERFGLFLARAGGAPEPYSGAPCSLVVRRDAPYLVELAATLAAILGGPSGLLTVTPVATTELVQLKRSRQFGFLLDQLRPLGPTPRDHQLSLLTEAGLPFKPPRLPPGTGTDDVPAIVCPTVALAVVGSLHLLWATLPQLQLPSNGLADAWLRGA